MMAWTILTIVLYVIRNVIANYAKNIKKSQQIYHYLRINKKFYVIIVSKSVLLLLNAGTKIVKSHFAIHVVQKFFNSLKWEKQ